MTRKESDVLIASLTEELRELPDGYTVSTTRLLKLAGYYSAADDRDLLAIHSHLFKAARKARITLDISAHDGKDEGLPFDLDFVVHNQRAQIKCPFCGSRDTARILYGKPNMTEYLENKIRQKKVVLGGCRIEEAESGGSRIVTAPKRHCNECGKDFGRPPVTAADGTAINYLATVESMDFSRSGARGPSFTTVHFERTTDGAAVIKAEGHFSFDFSESIITRLDPKKRDAVLNKLFNEMYLHEWPAEYYACVLDGESWTIDISFSDGSHRTYRGSNCYPAYWNELCQMLRPYSHTFGKNHA